MCTTSVSCSIVVLLGLTAAAVRAQDTTPAAAAQCISCHAQGDDPDAPNFATLAGQHPEYLVKQLKEYMSGRRKSDIMAPIVANLKKRDLPSLAAYFPKQIPVPGKIEDEALARQGKALYEGGNPATGVPNCAGCHKANGAGSARYPRLTGQLQAYTVQQMADFKSGTRANDQARVMRLLASRMTDDEIKAVAEYVAGLTDR